MATASLIMLINLSFGIGTTLYLLKLRNSSPPSATFSKVHTYIIQSISMMYRWCLVAASFDRYAITSTDLCLRSFARMNIARRTIAVIIVAWIVFPMHNLIYNTANMNSNNFTYNTALLYYHSSFTVVAGCILPASIMIICAFLTYHNLVLKRKRRQNMVTPHARNNSDVKLLERKRDRQVLLILIVQVVVFVITIIPLTVSHFYNAVALNIRNKSIERITIERFAAYWASLSVYLFPTLSFYLYTMTSSIFRDELKKLVRLILRCGCIRRSVRIAPAANQTQNRAATKH
ncbi:unnamed protein product [Rotaria socialis]|uniref:G-protein coupled receptors family 1 profile domain-containing protein n=2 Tax=Rotaria socialis TaxID=392032 RepID=A0A820V3H7_9BILA|nr:unnamed protein product [Rotaria socialis]CAF3418250.1 unnamed protein product [Rotaria socialis]CAF3706288.1 unnamed protein product [Rotaria socialis]CAF3718508.1 unnamed protein product [Rotaria socialis]CAF3778010.1 unnamed protein product [Rotaria socialis]